MKQSEIDRELRLIAKAEAKKRGWKYVGGMPYWTIGPLFFVIVQSANAKEGSFYSSLRFKWLELDHLLWKVLDMSCNEDAPFSLHANGAFVLSGQEIQTSPRRGLIWSPGVLTEQVESIAELCAQRANEVASQISSLHSYLEFLRREHEAFMQHFPRAVVDVWKEELLAALTTNDLTTATQIARSRIAVGDSGGFSSGGKSFYERALELCEP